MSYTIPMNHHSRTYLTAFFIVIVVVLLLAARDHARRPKPVAVAQPIASVSYVCNGNKTIDASFYEGTSTPAVTSDQPPVPGGSVKIALGDGRDLTLSQTISADGARYANADESLVFWSKGTGAFVTEQDKQTYDGCIEVASESSDLPNVFASSAEGFSIRYPQGYAIDTTYRYQTFGPGKDIKGVKFTVSASTTAGTNLVSDSYVSVEELLNTKTCVASLFLSNKALAHDLVEGDMTYSVASSTGAAAGNRYNETIYALPGTSPCVAVHYFVHYGVFENYPAGSIKEFDEASLAHTFGQMRRSLTLVD